MLELVKSWAPLIWLHSEDVFYPSSVEFFLPEVTLNDINNNVSYEYVTVQNLPGGSGSSYYHMQTREELGELLFTFMLLLVHEQVLNKISQNDIQQFLLH